MANFAHLKIFGGGSVRLATRKATDSAAPRELSGPAIGRAIDGKSARAQATGRPAGAIAYLSGPRVRGKQGPEARGRNFAPGSRKLRRFLKFPAGGSPAVAVVPSRRRRRICSSAAR